MSSAHPPQARAGHPDEDGIPRCRLLGPLEVRVGHVSMEISGSRDRIVLATLLTRLGQVVSTSAMVHAVWGPTPPRTARNQIATCVSRLRRDFRTTGCPDIISTRPNGYLLTTAAVWLDTAEFDRLRVMASEAHRNGRLSDAVRLLRESIALWRGPALADISSELLQAEADRLHESRRDAMESLFEAELAAGRHREIVAELLRYVRLHPLRERARATLMTALHRSGRTGDALLAYAEGRRLCVEELGVEPGAELQNTHAAVLTGNGHASEPVAGPADDAGTGPVDLPAPPAVFTGRHSLLRSLTSLAARPSSPGLTVACVTGIGGMGKTAAVLRWAHRAQAYFPDGRLFVSLTDHDGRSRSPVPALRQLLQAAGCPDRASGEDEQELAGTLRRVLHGRRLLLILDGARSYRQVRGLLPGSEDCMVVVTSRAPLPGLLTHHDARLFPLHELGHREAVELLRELGEHRGSGPDEATADHVAQACGGMPLALRVAAGQLASWPQGSGPVPAGLGDPSLQLDWLSEPGADVRACLADAVQNLDDTTLRAFITLSEARGPFDVSDAALRLGLCREEAEALCRRLAQAHLLTTSVTQGATVQHRMETLPRCYARELLITGTSVSRPSAALAKES